MQPKRTEIINYYDCYEVGYIELYCTGKGDPAGQHKNIIIRTLNKQGVEDLTKKYNINFVDYDDGYATGYYIREVEVTEDPELITGELNKLEEVWKKVWEEHEKIKKEEKLSAEILLSI